MHSSATRRVMRIPEIRSHIFSYSTPRTNFSNALVCKSWSDDALNALWREVEGPKCLFQLLAPLRSRENNGWEFSRCLSPDDWLRFDKYAQRVHSLDEYFGFRNADVDAWWYYDTSVFIQVSTTRPRLELLPNLRFLRYTGPPQFASLFFSASLKAVCFTVASEVDRSANDRVLLGAQSAFLFLPKCSPHLETLKSDFGFPCVAALNFVLARSLASLPMLTTLHLPDGWITKEVTHAVASHANLCTIHSTYSILSDPLRAYDAFSSDLNSEDFPSLQELLLTIPFSRAAACLSGGFCPSALTSLHLTSPTPDSLDDISFLVEAVAGSCPQLRSLHVSARLSDIEPSEQVDFRTISPLLACTQLRLLDLRHPVPFALTSDDVVAIVKGLPLLEYLNLNNGPTKLDPPTLPFSTLLKLPHFCHSLHYLGLYADATDPIEQITDIHIPRFSRLTTVSICRSPISSPLQVAEFLGRILPATADISLAFTDAHEHWRDASRFLKALLKIREEQRQRSMSLQGPY